MDLISIILIAVGLSMDSFAVSIADGLFVKDLNLRKIVGISFSLAFFQALMPVVGWVAGMRIEKYFQEFDHWVAFFLLWILGIKMIYEGRTNKDAEKETEFNVTLLISQSVATSIDALAVGLSFALLNNSIVLPVFIIGIITFGFSLVGLMIGKKMGRRTGKSVEILGGLVLLAIGAKILIEHICFNC